MSWELWCCPSCGRNLELNEQAPISAWCFDCRRPMVADVEGQCQEGGGSTRLKTEKRWSHDEMREALRDLRRFHREFELLGHAEGGPTDVVLAEMLEQLLIEGVGVMAETEWDIGGITVDEEQSIRIARHVCEGCEDTSGFVGMGLESPDESVFMHLKMGEASRLVELLGDALRDLRGQR